jgi:magnesium chelatase subunit I
MKTLKELHESGYQPKSIKDELRTNLLRHLKEGENVFEGLHGYEHSVIPQVERAILSKHNINFLGLRGQAKTKLARMLTRLLDERIPILAGSPLNEDPMRPISEIGKRLIAEHGDNTPIEWLHRDERYLEKLATPDVSVADLIGDIDPIKAANKKLDFSDPAVIHFGMIPRANRCIFVINELPDLQARIQVALFNILQEGDIQIRSFKLRLVLDLQFVFTANPEDYTNRGSIVTPLKDRIGSQILTHYPEDIETARKITMQEIKAASEQKENINIPEVALDLLEQVSFEARESEYVDAKSGVSARLTISALENLLSTAERRALLGGKTQTQIRLLDFLGIIPSITGKIELVYEGEQEGADNVAESLIGSAIKNTLSSYFPVLENIKVSDKDNPYGEIIQWFAEGNQAELYEEFSDKDYSKILLSIKPLQAFIDKHRPETNDGERMFFGEMILWGLAETAKLNKEHLIGGINYSDLFSSYLRSGEL